MRKVKAVKPPPNKKRGVSAIRQTGPRHPLTVAKYPLPEPVFDPPLRRQIQKTRSDHGLWGFFHDQDKKTSSLTSPEDVHAHGRSWTYAELQIKGWDDLSTIWWSCLKERNWLATEKLEIQRMRAGFGEVEIQKRDLTVQQTMRNIRKVLTDRSGAFEEAVKALGSADFWKKELQRSDESEAEASGELFEPSRRLSLEQPPKTSQGIPGYEGRSR